VRSKHHEKNNEDLDDLGCLFVVLSDVVSSKAARSVVKQAFARFGRYRQLTAAVLPAVVADPAFVNDERLAETEGAVLRAIIAYEISTNADTAWSFEKGGLRKLQDDFMLLSEYLGLRHSPLLKGLYERWGDFFLTDADNAELQNVPGEERDAKRSDLLRTALHPICFFFVALCHALQEGENELSEYDAYWLGLIDEIIGEDLPCTRLLWSSYPKRKQPPMGRLIPTLAPGRPASFLYRHVWVVCCYAHWPAGPIRTTHPICPA
jgi:hypothetical protein